MHRTPRRIAATIALAALVACADEPSEAPTPPAEPPAAEKVIPDQIDPSTADLNARLTLYALPAPSEILALLDEHGESDALRDALGGDLPTYEGLAPWQAALATGAATADLLVVIRDAPADDLARRLKNVSDGMTAGGADATVTDALAELHGAVTGGAVSRDALISQFDLFHADLLGRGGSSLGDQNLALLAIGGWARAVNLVARRATETGVAPKGADLLKLQVVVEALRQRLGEAPEVQPVRDALDRILPVSTTAAEEPSADDLVVLRDATGEILAAAGIGGSK